MCEGGSTPALPEQQHSDHCCGQRWRTSSQHQKTRTWGFAKGSRWSSFHPRPEVTSSFTVSSKELMGSRDFWTPSSSYPHLFKKDPFRKIVRSRRGSLFISQIICFPLE